MRIFSYYAHVHGISPEDSTRLMLLWTENWRHFGFEPVFLNEYTARKHPRFKEFDERIAKLPTINAREYERACYLRYMAVAVAGGGIMADYDVFCYQKPNIHAKVPATAIGLQRHVPSLIYGDKRAFEKFIDFIMGYQLSIADIDEQKGVPHVSDMHMIHRSPNPPLRMAPVAVRNFGDEGWMTAPFVHYANVTMQKHQPRWQHIQQLRNWK